MRIAYITVATGNYEVFIDGLIKSGTENFFPKCETEFIILTDSSKHLSSHLPKVRFIKQNRLGFPHDTLKRFHLINEIKDSLDHNYLFFGNVNLIFNKPIGEEILPNKDSTGLLGVTHPGFHNTDKKNYTYERDPRSTAYVPHGLEGNTYYQGCFFGGERVSFLEMSAELEKRIDDDLHKDIISVWWDESHLNKYFIEKPPKTLHPGYAYTDDDPLFFNLGKFDRHITQLDKRKYGGHQELRYN